MQVLHFATLLTGALTQGVIHVELEECTTAFDRDSQIYIVRDYTGPDYKTYNYWLGEGFKEVERLYAETRYEVSASFGFGAYANFPECFTEYTVDGTLSEVSSDIKETPPVTITSITFEGVHLFVALFLQAGRWHTAAGPSLRRILMIITRDTPPDYMNVVPTYVKDTAVVRNNCPMTLTQPDPAEVGLALRRSEAGLAVFMAPVYYEIAFRPWQAFFDRTGHNDAFVHGTSYTDLTGHNIANLLQYLICPTWLSSTSTTTTSAPTTARPTTLIATTLTSQTVPITTSPPSYTQRDILECLLQLNKCGISDPQYISDELYKCLTHLS